MPRVEFADDRQVDRRCGHDDGDQLPAYDHREADAHRDAHRVDGNRASPRFLREIVADHRQRARAQARLADADADAGHEELRVVPGQPTGRGHEAPHGNADRDDHAPAVTVSEAADRDA